MNTRFERCCTIFRVGQDPSTLESPQCGNHIVRKEGKAIRVFKAVPIGLHPVKIECPVQRVLCLACDAAWRVKIQSTD